MRRPLPLDNLLAYRLLAPLAWMACVVFAHPALAGAEDAPKTPDIALACEPGTGAWLPAGNDASSRHLTGVLCRGGDRCGGFASFEVQPDGTTKVRYAALPETIGCELTWQGAVGPFALYHDGTRLLAVSPETLEVSWVAELPPGRPQESPNRPFLLLYPDRLIRFVAADVPKIDWDVPLEAARELVWQDDRLIVVEETGLRFFPLVDGKPQAAQRIDFREPLGESLYAVDHDGLMREEGNGRRISWYGFGPDESARAGLNSDEEIREIAGAPGELVAVTTDGVATNMVVRSGAMLRERLELRYWKLENSDRVGPVGRRPLVMRLGDALVLDGGAAGARASIIDSSRLTWKPRGKLSYPAPGQLVQMLAERLVTVHPTGEHLLTEWSIPRGQLEPHLSRVQATKAGLGKLVDVRVLSDNSFLLRDAKGAVAVYDMRRKMLSNVIRAWTPKSGLRLQWVDARHLVFSEVTDKGAVISWHLLGLDGSHSFVPAAGALTDALSPTQRWFGYCVPTLPCALQAPTFTALAGANDTLKGLPTLPEVARDPRMALIFVGASLLLGMLIVVWRLGLGRRGYVDQQPGMGASVGGLGALLDSRGRRYVTQREMEGFVDHALTQLPWRLGIALATGTAAAAVFGYEWVIVEPPEVALPFAAALATPTTVITWIIVSWGVWNRHKLLRFGHAIEGQWFDSGTRKQSVCYTTSAGKTYRLRRGQWIRADLVPIILFDPRRPRFAAQYTGNGQFPIAPRGDVSQLSGNAVTRDGVRLVLVLVLLICAGAGAFDAFERGFPEPISKRRLAAIEAKAQEDEAAMLAPCIEACAAASDVPACHALCEKRQLGHVLRAQGVDVVGTPELAPETVRQRQLGWLQDVVALLAHTDLTCDALAAQIEAAPRWTPDLIAAYAAAFEVGVGEDRSADARAHIAELRATYFEHLCLPEEACLSGSKPCPDAPACAGSMAKLRASMCGYAAVAASLPTPAPNPSSPQAGSAE